MKDLGMMELYVFSKPDEEIDTQYGRIPYREFLEKERDRIGGAPGREAEIHWKHGKCALIVNRVAVGGD
jgi:hypothetical protein